MGLYGCNYRDRWKNIKNNKVISCCGKGGIYFRVYMKCVCMCKSSADVAIRETGSAEEMKRVLGHILVECQMVWLSLINKKKFHHTTIFVLLAYLSISCVLYPATWLCCCMICNHGVQASRKYQTDSDWFTDSKFHITRYDSNFQL